MSTSRPTTCYCVYLCSMQCISGHVRRCAYTCRLSNTIQVWAEDNDMSEHSCAPKTQALQTCTYIYTQHVHMYAPTLPSSGSAAPTHMYVRSTQALHVRRPTLTLFKPGILNMCLSAPCPITYLDFQVMHLQRIEHDFESTIVIRT